MICNLNETNSQLAPIRLPSTNNSYCCNPTTIPPYGKYEIVTSFDKQASLMTWKKVHMSKTHASTRTEELSNYKDIQNQSISSNSIESNLSSINTANPEINLTLDRQTASLPHSQSQSDHLLNQHSHLSSRNRESTTMDLKTDDETETQKLNYMKSNFPIKLYRLILSEKSDHIQWMNGGKTFQIHDINRFIKDILPKYFKDIKADSFKRQLNMYGFRKIRRHRALRTFAHPLFQEGRTDLLPHIRRVNSMVSKVPTPSAAASIASTVALGSVAAVEISNDSLKSSVHNLNASRTISTDIEHMASPVATKQSDVETADSNSNGTTVSNTLERSVVRYGAVVGHPVSLPSGKQIVPVLNQESMYQPHMTISSDSYLTSTTASSSQQLTDDDEESYCSIY